MLRAACFFEGAIGAQVASGTGFEGDGGIHEVGYQLCELFLEEGEQFGGEVVLSAPGDGEQRTVETSEWLDA